MTYLEGKEIDREVIKNNLRTKMYKSVIVNRHDIENGQR